MKCYHATINLTKKIVYIKLKTYVFQQMLIFQLYLDNIFKYKLHFACKELVRWSCSFILNPEQNEEYIMIM